MEPLDSAAMLREADAAAIAYARGEDPGSNSPNYPYLSGVLQEMLRRTVRDYNCALETIAKLRVQREELLDEIEARSETT